MTGVCVGQDVRVTVERGGHPLVAEDSGTIVDRQATGDQPRRVRTEIVKAKRRTRAPTDRGHRLGLGLAEALRRFPSRSVHEDKAVVSW